jgi:hypothetical protein
MTGVRDKPWLKAGSLAHKKLVLALRGYKDSRLKDLRHMTENQQTCKNEQLNNVHNIYMPKHTFFGPVQVEFSQLPKLFVYLPSLSACLFSVLRIRDVYPGSRIPDPDFYPSRIPDPKTGTNERGKKKLVVIPFCVATNFTKL